MILFCFTKLLGTDVTVSIFPSFLVSLRLCFPLKQLCAIFSSDVHHLTGARDPAQRRPAAAGQPGDLPGRQPVLLPPPGPQAQEDVSRPRRG